MGEGPQWSLAQRDLEKMFARGAQQALGAEHVSDIGVYYDDWRWPASLLQQAGSGAVRQASFDPWFDLFRLIAREAATDAV